MFFVKCSQKKIEWDDEHMRNTKYKAEWRANMKVKSTKFKEKKSLKDRNMKPEDSLEQEAHISEAEKRKAAKVCVDWIHQGE